MSSQHGAQRLLKKVGRTVVSCRQRTLLRIDLKGHFISVFDHAFCHHADVADLAAEEFYGIFYFEFTFRRADISGVGFLAAACGIERRLMNEDCSLLSFRQRVHDLIFRGEHGYVRLIGQVVITDEGACDGRIDGFIYSNVRAHVVCHFAGVAGFLSLYFHT